MRRDREPFPRAAPTGPLLRLDVSNRLEGVERAYPQQTQMLPNRLQQAHRLDSHGAELRTLTRDHRRGKSQRRRKRGERRGSHSRRSPRMLRRRLPSWWMKSGQPPPQTQGDSYRRPMSELVAPRFDGRVKLTSPSSSAGALSCVWYNNPRSEQKQAWIRSLSVEFVHLSRSFPAELTSMFVTAAHCTRSSRTGFRA